MLKQFDCGREMQSVPKNRETRSPLFQRDANTSTRSAQMKEQATSKLAAADLCTDPGKRCLGASLSRNQEWRNPVALETGTCLRQSAHLLAHPVAKGLSCPRCRACRLSCINCSSHRVCPLSFLFFITSSPHYKHTALPSTMISLSTSLMMAASLAPLAAARTMTVKNSTLAQPLPSSSSLSTHT